MHQSTFNIFSICILMLASAPAAEDPAPAADAPANGKQTEQNVALYCKGPAVRWAVRTWKKMLGV